MVMGDDSCLRGCGFEFRHQIPDGYDIFHIDLYCLFGKTENKRKRCQGWPNFFKKLNFRNSKIFSFGEIILTPKNARGGREELVSMRTS